MLTVPHTDTTAEDGVLSTVLLEVAVGNGRRHSKWPAGPEGYIGCLNHWLQTAKKAIQVYACLLIPNFRQRSWQARGVLYGGTIMGLFWSYSSTSSIIIVAVVVLRAVTLDQTTASAGAHIVCQYSVVP